MDGQARVQGCCVSRALARLVGAPLAMPAAAAPIEVPEFETGAALLE